jgi:hypothetical protein
MPSAAATRRNRLGIYVCCPKLHSINDVLSHLGIYATPFEVIMGLHMAVLWCSATHCKLD